MINPINLIKVDDIRGSDGKTFHVGKLPDYDETDYDLSSPKDFEKFVKDVKAEIRGSFEYREMIKYLKTYGGMDRSGISGISSTDSNHVKVEVHHTPFVLEDIVRIVYEKRLYYHQDLSVQMVAKEVMEDHYMCLVGLFPVTSTEHELVHNGYLFIPPNDVFGNYRQFMYDYGTFLDDDDVNTIDEIESYAVHFDPSSQNSLLSQSNIYIDPVGAYKVPELTSLGNAMSNRIDTIKNNMYMLPTVGAKSETPKMEELMYFTNEKGERIDEPIS